VLRKTRNRIASLKIMPGGEPDANAASG